MNGFSKRVALLILEKKGWLTKNGEEKMRN